MAESVQVSALENFCKDGQGLIDKMNSAVSAGIRGMTSFVREVQKFSRIVKDKLNEIEDFCVHAPGEWASNVCKDAIVHHETCQCSIRSRKFLVDVFVKEIEKVPGLLLESALGNGATADNVPHFQQGFPLRHFTIYGEIKGGRMEGGVSVDLRMMDSVNFRGNVVPIARFCSAHSGHLRHSFDFFKNFARNAEKEAQKILNRATNEINAKINVLRDYLERLWNAVKVHTARCKSSCAHDSRRKCPDGGCGRCRTPTHEDTFASG